MSYEETHHFALVSQNNKHIKKYINLQDVERTPCYVHLKKNSIKCFLIHIIFLIVIFIIIVVSV